MDSNKSSDSDVFQATSEWVGSMAALLLGNEHFRNGVQRVITTSLEARNQFESKLQNALERLPIAAKEDVETLQAEHEELGEQLYAIEERLAEMDGKLDLVLEKLDKLGKPKTVRKTKTKAKTKATPEKS